jgi:hypothetical protein
MALMRVCEREQQQSKNDDDTLPGKVVSLPHKEFDDVLSGFGTDRAARRRPPALDRPGTPVPAGR